MVSLSGLIPCNTPWMAVAGVRATASSSNALHLPIFADRQAVSVQRERWHTAPHSIPPLTTLEFYHRIAGGILHHAQRMIRQEILLETLLLVSIKPGKIRLVIGKNTGHQFDIRAVIVSQALIPRLAKFTVSPAPLFFYLAQYGGWQRVANHHLHRDTTRQQNRTVIFSIYEVGTGTFYSEKCPLRGVVHFVVSAGGDGESGDGPFA